MLEETVFGDKGIPVASDRINYLQKLTLSQSTILWMQTSTEPQKQFQKVKLEQF